MLAPPLSEEEAFLEKVYESQETFGAVPRVGLSAILSTYYLKKAKTNFFYNHNYRILARNGIIH